MVIYDNDDSNEEAIDLLLKEYNAIILHNL